MFDDKDKVNYGISGFNLPPERKIIRTIVKDPYGNILI
jgi:hypothetical protein